VRTIVVVGGSLAGLRAGETLRREGFDGELVIVSAEDRLPYDRPPLSKQVLAGSWEAEQTVLHGGAELEATWLLGRRATALTIGPPHRVALDDGEALFADGVVVATGASPRMLPGTEPMEGVFVLRTLEDCLRLRAELERGPRVVVVGAGFIGSEVAATCRERGLQVTVLEALAVPLERALGPAMGAFCADLHRDHGTDVRLGVGVDGMTPDGTGRAARVELSDGTAVEADVVVVGVGVAPETGWLAGSGLTIDNGVVCDEWCQAGPGVVAAGDVARWPNPRFGGQMRVEHWTNAVEQGTAAARTLLHGPADGEQYAPVPYFWSDQYDAKMQYVGHASGQDEVDVVEGSVADRRFVAAYGREGRLVAALAVNWPARAMHYRKLIAQAAAFPRP